METIIYSSVKKKLITNSSPVEAIMMSAVCCGVVMDNLREQVEEQYEPGDLVHLGEIIFKSTELGPGYIEVEIFSPFC